MAASNTAAKKKRPGCLRILGSAMLFLCFMGMVALVVCMVIPQDLSDIKGREEALQDKRARDLAEVLRKSHEKGHSVVISEEEINQWLHQTLVAKQGGLLGKWVTITGVWARISDGSVELIQEREAFGRTFTISMYLTLEVLTQDGKQAKRFHLNKGPFIASVPKPRRGGRCGTVTVPEGFLMFVLPSYKQLAELYRSEIRLAFQEMLEIRFEEDRMELVPWPKGSGGSPARTHSSPGR